MSKIVFIVNPHAGHRSTGSSWPFIEALAKDRLGPFEVFMTARPGDATIFAENAIADQANLLISVGGDGTLNEVINGVMNHEKSVRSNVTLGFIPNGTGCDFVRTVSIPQDIEQAVDLIVSGSVFNMDVGALAFIDHKGRDCCRFFHNIASFGLGGDVAQRVNRTTKALGPFVSFMWATLISVFLYGTKKVRILVDGSFEKEVSVWNVVVANGQYHGGGMWVAPDASICDGLLNITVIGDLTIPEVLIHLPKLYNGRICDIDKVITLTGKKVVAVSNDRVLLEVDGEQPGMLPMAVKMVPGALKIITQASHQNIGERPLSS